MRQANAALSTKGKLRLDLRDCRVSDDIHTLPNSRAKIGRIVAEDRRDAPDLGIYIQGVQVDSRIPNAKTIDGLRRKNNKNKIRWLVALGCGVESRHRREVVEEWSGWRLTTMDKDRWGLEGSRNECREAVMHTHALSLSLLFLCFSRGRSKEDATIIK